MDCADRAVLSDLDQAVDLAEGFPHEQVGVRPVERAGSRIPSSPSCDRTLPPRADVLLAGGSVREGSIDLPPFVTIVDAAGHQGYIGVAMAPADVWGSPRGRRRPRRRSDTGTLPSLASDLRSTRDTTAAPGRTNPASSGR